MKKILITGGGGFIGSHLVNNLTKQGYNVIVTNNLSSKRKENINPKVKFYKIDIRDPGIYQIFKKEKIDTVFHLAVQSNAENPLECLDVNIMGTVNILEACRKKGDLKSIIIVSSYKAYGKSKELPYKETTPLRGDHPYDVSKASADLIAQCYFKTYKLPIAISRFSNVFGPGNLNFFTIIPGILRAIIKNEEFLIRSNGKALRQYIYVQDAVDGCIKLFKNIKKTRGEIFNFGSKNIFSAEELIKKVERILNTKVRYKILTIAKNEIPEQYLDWSKAKEKLGWQPKATFEEGIKKTFDWYKDNL